MTRNITENNKPMSKLLYEDLTHRIIGAAQEVYKELSYGYLESVYENALCHELSLIDILRNYSLGNTIKIRLF